MSVEVEQVKGAEPRIVGRQTCHGAAGCKLLEYVQASVYVCVHMYTHVLWIFLHTSTCITCRSEHCFSAYVLVRVCTCVYASVLPRTYRTEHSCCMCLLLCMCVYVCWPPSFLFSGEVSDSSSHSSGIPVIRGLGLDSPGKQFLLEGTENASFYGSTRPILLMPRQHTQVHSCLLWSGD